MTIAALPLVTCICPTMPSRREWLPKAIACFMAQTYANRRMLIVTDGNRMEQSAVIPQDERISLALDAPPGISLGAKRNLCCELAEGEIIAHFDDDDWSAPGRLADQVNRLASTGKSVTGYHSMLFMDGANWWRNANSPTVWAYDSSLCYLKSFWMRHPFSEISDGLEAEFRRAAIREREFISVDAGDLMYATIHSENTSRRVIGEGWESVAPPQLLDKQGH